MKINYQLKCEEQIECILRKKADAKLLLHSCCGPCSTYVLKYLTEFFDVSLLFFNPNIYPAEEYEKRLETQREVIEKMNFKKTVSLLTVPYDYDEFVCVAGNLGSAPEGGARCTECFKLRLKQTAQMAAEQGFDCFATTLSVSPHKNAALINEIGVRFSEEYGVEYLLSDFKKREGYKQSVTLSKDLGLYRQEYCGCEFSLR